MPTSNGPPVAKVKAPAASDKLKYGKYLVDIGHCVECHTPVKEKGELMLAKLGAGGQVIEGASGQDRIAQPDTDRFERLDRCPDCQGHPRRCGPQRSALPAADGLRVL